MTNFRPGAPVSTDPDLSFLSTDGSPDRPPTPIRLINDADWDATVAALPEAWRRWLEATGPKRGSGDCAVVPGEHGEIAAAIMAVPRDPSPYHFGDLPLRLPATETYFFDETDIDLNQAVLGYCLGAYYYDLFRSPKRAVPVLRMPGGLAPGTLAEARAIAMARTLINHPANVLGPRELADAASGVFAAQGGVAEIIAGDALATRYPLIAAVGAGSDRPPLAVIARWQGNDAPDAPHVSLVGKGVCFDTGGYDLKPSAGMAAMKKDMAGAAVALGVARVVMERRLPVRLSVRLGCVENSVSGRAMRPRDVVRSARGLSVEIGDTDAEGRLVLADLLAEASAEAPSVLLDWATLTGAARVALGPDLPALFSNDDVLAGQVAESASLVHEPVWRLPLWNGYDAWLDSTIADLSNISGRPHAGAIVAALFLRRFVAPGTRWAHFDVYGANDKAAPGRPEGGEAHGLRAALALIDRFVIPGMN